MNDLPDYSKCSLRELHDVAARIDKANFLDRYALVSREIKRRETSRETETLLARKRAPAMQNFIEAIYIIGGAIMGFVVGVVWLSMTSLDTNPDSPNGIIEMMAAIIVGAFAGKFGAKMRKRTRNGKR